MAAAHRQQRAMWMLIAVIGAMAGRMHGNHVSLELQGYVSFSLVQGVSSHNGTVAIAGDNQTCHLLVRDGDSGWVEGSAVHTPFPEVASGAFAHSVGMFNDTLVVGAPRTSWGGSAGGGVFAGLRGVAYVYHRGADEASHRWNTRDAHVLAMPVDHESNAFASRVCVGGDYFVASVDPSTRVNASTTEVVSHGGHAVFTRDALGAWHANWTLLDERLSGTSETYHSGALSCFQSTRRMGFAYDVQPPNGETLEDSSSVTLYTHASGANRNGWTNQSMQPYLRGPIGSRAHFGISLSLSLNSDGYGALAVGVRDAGPSSGTIGVYFERRTSSGDYVWLYSQPVSRQAAVNAGRTVTNTGSLLGKTVAMGDSVLLVGSELNTLNQSGIQYPIADDQVNGSIASACEASAGTPCPPASAGAAYMYVFAGKWHFEAFIRPPLENVTQVNRFGRYMSIMQDTLVICDVSQCFFYSCDGCDWPLNRTTHATSMDRGNANAKQEHHTAHPTSSWWWFS